MMEEDHVLVCPHCGYETNEPRDDELPPPTEGEKQDAIRVLEDPSNEAHPGLWEEAHRIFFGDN